MESKRTFYSKTNLQAYIDENKLPLKVDDFDLQMDAKIKQLRKIWKEYKVEPFLSTYNGKTISDKIKPAQVIETIAG